MTGPQPLLPIARSRSPYSHSPTWGSASPTSSSPLASRRPRSPAMNSSVDMSSLAGPTSMRRSLSSATTSSAAALSSELLSQTARHAKEVRGAVGESMQLRQIMEKQEKKISFLIGELKATRAKLNKNEAELQSALVSLDRLLAERKDFEQQLAEGKSMHRRLKAQIESLEEELSRSRSAASRGYADQSCASPRDDSPRSTRSNGDRARAKAALIEAENLRLKEDLNRMEMEAAVLKRALVLRSHELHVSINDMQETARYHVETQQMRDEAVRARDEIDSLRGDCGTYRAEIDRLKSEVNHLSSSLSKSEKASREIEKERDQAKQEAHLAALERMSVMNRAGHLPAQLDEAREKIRQLEEELSRKTGELSGLTTSLSAAASEWSHERTLLTSKIDKYEQLLTEMGDERRHLRDDLDKARMENARLAADFKDSSEKATANEIAANASREQLSSLESQIDGLRRDVIANKTEMKRRDADARRLKAEVTRGHQLVRAASGRDRSEELVDELREGLATKEEELRKLRHEQYSLESSLVNRVSDLRGQLDAALSGRRGTVRAGVVTSRCSSPLL
ncbi:hypothetical protein FOZ60_007078 [Perkinsus olseni]|uniref:Uncharacterized protein n=1 Tax=Perkinsus olseni TaxID=32597 RepID=A0A7J6NM62_PEROL|nr:hypothetical protein FOZ60_007078 [Perkinsus olseni]